MFCVYERRSLCLASSVLRNRWVGEGVRERAVEGGLERELAPGEDARAEEVDEAEDGAEGQRHEGAGADLASACARTADP